MSVPIIIPFGNKELITNNDVHVCGELYWQKILYNAASEYHFRCSAVIANSSQAVNVSLYNLSDSTTMATVTLTGSVGLLNASSSFSYPGLLSFDILEARVSIGSIDYGIVEFEGAELCLYR